MRKDEASCNVSVELICDYSVVSNDRVLHSPRPHLLRGRSGVENASFARRVRPIPPLLAPTEVLEK